MILSLVAANKLGAEGAGKAISIGKKLSNKVQSGAKRGAGAATFGLAAKGSQATAGALANAASNNRRFQNFAANNKLGRAALAGTRKVADASFDARRVGGLGKELGIGEGKKGGFVTAIKAREKKDEEFMKSLADADMKDPKNQARAAALAAEKSASAQQKKGAAETTTQQAEGDKEIVAARWANEAKSEKELAGEISGLEEQIVALNVSIRNRTAAGTITTDEKVDIERRLEEKRAGLRSKNLAREDIIKQTALTNEYNNAKSAEDAAIDPAQKAILRERHQQLAKEISAHKNLEQRKTLADEAIAKAKEDTAAANKEIAQASAKAADEIKFENKTAFLNNVGKKSERTFTPLEKASFENLKKKFGKDASEMASKDKDSKASAKLAADLKALQDSQGSGDKGGGDEGSKDAK